MVLGLCLGSIRKQYVSLVGSDLFCNWTLQCCKNDRGKLQIICQNRIEMRSSETTLATRLEDF